VEKAPSPRAEGRRQLAAGWVALSRGQRAEADKAFGAAGEAFQKAIEDHKKRTGEARGPWEDYFGLGRAQMLRGEWALAQVAFAGARKARAAGARGAVEEPSVLVCRAYCHTALGQHANAITLYQEAMKAGLRTAAVRNNLAYSTFCVRRSPQDLGRAKRLLQEALRLEPDLRPALRNRAFLAFTKHMDERGLPGAQALPLWVADDLDRVVKMGGLPGQEDPSSLYVLAAHVHARTLADREAHRFDDAEAQRRRERIRELVQRACVVGAQHGPLLRDEDLQSALGDWLTEANLPAAQQAAVPGPSTYLADPLGAPLG
jgi:tetratricopeptide (TPR) repeat protein